MDSELLDIYLMGDQPTTCGICGARTDFEVKDDRSQIHKCLDRGCGHVFLVVDD